MNEHPLVQFIQATCGLIFAALVLHVGWAVLHPSSGSSEPAVAAATVTVPPQTAPAPTRAEIAVDLKRCAGIAKSMRNTVGALVYGISASDAGWLAQGADADDRLAQMISQDPAPASIRALPAHAKFVSDAAGALSLMGQLAGDAANFLGGDSSIKFTDLRHEAMLTEAAVSATNGDLRAYRAFAKHPSTN